MNVAIIGNDARMDYVAEQLYALGCEVSRDLNKLNNDTNLILSPPVTEDCYEYIKPYLCKVSRIYGGCISDGFKAKLNDKVQLMDYLSWDYVIAENAKLTAQGIIKEALANNANLEGSNILVTGYGFCGKAIAFALKNIGTNVTISVRNHKLKGEILSAGFEYLGIQELCDSDISKFNYVFNTVPALVINKQVIEGFNNSIMIFDIASKPGGVDFDYCRDKGIFSILSLGIPGREYPKEAGYLIGSACYNHYNSLL